jgi:hypothetical protein
VRLFACDKSSIQELQVENLPSNMDEVVAGKSIDKQLQRHSGAGQSESVFHGHQGDTDFEKNNQEHFLRAVESAVSKYLQGKTEPLVLAGVERIVSDYKHLNSYKQLAEGFVHGSFDRIPESEIHSKAKQLV